jgi:hypothetical protein
MKYGVISDSHDNFYNLEQAMKIIKRRGIKVFFHLGDYCAPGFVRAMMAHKGVKWICVWGNVDGAKAKILLEQCKNPNFDMAEEAFREFETPEGKIFLSHFSLLAELAAESGRYKATFYGDNHTKRVEKLENGTLLANPGELSGFMTGQPSFGIWNAVTNKMEIIDLKDFRVTK